MKVLIFMLMFVLINEMALAQTQFKKRYTNHTEFGGLFGRVKYSFGSEQNQVDSKVSLTLQTFNGVMINKRFSAGITVGVDWYKTALINPVALGVRYDFTKKKNARLFGSIDAGYGFGWLQQDSDNFNTKGGLMLNPGIGMRYGKPGGNAFTIGLSYKRQNVHVDKPLQWEQIERFEDRVYNRMALRLGMSF